MKTILSLIITLFICGNVHAATLTAGNVPSVNTGGSTPKLQNSVVWTDGTNVGIGTTIPATTFDVIGTMRATTIQAGTGSATISGDSNGNIGLGTVTAGNKIAIGSTSGSNFDTNGNLGIGTTNIPSGDKVYVAGQITTTTGVKIIPNAAAGNILVSNGVGLGTWMPSSTISASGGGYFIPGNVGITTTSAVGLGTVNPGTALDVVGNIRNTGNIIVSGNIGIASVSPGQAIDVNGAIRSIASGNTTLAVGSGNVGVGTATPGQILDVFCSAGTCMRAVGLGTTVPQQLCITNGKIGYFNGAWASSCTTP